MTDASCAAIIKKPFAAEGSEHISAVVNIGNQQQPVPPNLLVALAGSIKPNTLALTRKGSLRRQ
jgi:hypothetical protein